MLLDSFVHNLTVNSANVKKLFVVKMYHIVLMKSNFYNRLKLKSSENTGKSH